MRTPTIASIFYTPAPPTQDEDLSRYVYNELNKVAASIRALAEGHLEVSYAAPVKPREGDIRLADGTTWNPGSGKGVYCYYSSAWHLLG